MRFSKTLPPYLFILFVLPLSGCAPNRTATTESITNEDRSRTFEREFHRTFNIVLRTLRQEGFGIENADAGNGLIYTDYRRPSSLRSSLDGVQKIKVNAQIEDRGNGSRVTLTVDVQQHITLVGSPSDYVSPRQARQYYADLFSKITGAMTSGD